MVKETAYKKQLENKAGEQNIEIQVKKKKSDQMKKLMRGVQNQGRLLGGGEY